MDFETIIPFIIIAVAYLFKAFENARKKDAKKKPRQPEGRKAPPAPPRRPLARPTGQPAPADRQPAPVPAARPLSQPVRPPVPPVERSPSWPDSTWWEADYPPTSSQGAAASVSDDRSSQRTVPDEVLRLREARQKKQPEAAFRSPAEMVVADAEGDEPFDLRDAVIKSVILERKEF